MKLMIDISEDLYNNMKSRYEYQNETDNNLSVFEKIGIAVKNGTPLPKNPTNGDMIKALFPKAIFCAPTENEFTKAFIRPNGSVVINDYCDDWWNAPYREGDGE